MSIPRVTREPAKRPCGECPYRQDAPSGLWAEQEYHRLPGYDEPTWAQPQVLFGCHQQDGRVCAGWAGCHDMEQSLALRCAVLSEQISPQVADALLDYATTTALFGSGQEAAEHGLADIAAPSPATQAKAARLARRARRVGRLS